ncbi:MAG TPA: hypothetical protein VFB63_06400 [Bryobacteraceae bacterium]|nr:hypothetical protein [Bryobacteraceae bacterium]
MNLLQEVFYWVLMVGVVLTGGAWAKLRLELQQGGPWTPDELWAARKQSWAEHQRRGLPVRTRQFFKAGACAMGVGFVGMFAAMLMG